MESNFETALEAEMKAVVRCFQRFTSEQRANHAASHRCGVRHRGRVGEFFYIHPKVPGLAFSRRRDAAVAALESAS